jgi:hypothetical protein
VVCQLGDGLQVDRVGLDPTTTHHPPLLGDMRRIQLAQLPGSRPAGRRNQRLVVVTGGLGIGTAETLRKWVRRAEIDDGRRPGLTSEEHAESKRLTRGPYGRMPDLHCADQRLISCRNIRP